MSAHPQLVTDFKRLTNRQQQVLHLLSENRTGKEIARVLDISPSAVDQHLRSVRQHFGPLPRSELSRLYREFEDAISPQHGPSLNGRRSQAPSSTDDVRAPIEDPRLEREGLTHSNVVLACIRSARFVVGLMIGLTIGVATSNLTIAVMYMAR